MPTVKGVKESNILQTCGDNVVELGGAEERVRVVGGGRGKERRRGREGIVGGG